MDAHYVRAVFDIDCNWHGRPPVYRVYVNDELFTEREWIWGTNVYVTQTLQMQAPSGKYTVRVEPVNSDHASISTRNHRIEYGPARWQKQHKIIIQP